MKAALVVHTVTTSRQKNMATVLKMVEEAAEGGATLVLFAEAALTGLTNNDDPAHDLPLGEPIPGAATQCLCAVAAERRICVAIGLLEREGGKLYDAAILVDANGTIQLKYRRIQPQWHGHRADTNVYCQGSEVPKAETAFGSVSFLICGDLFDDEIVSRARQTNPDWILYPVALSFDDGSVDPQRWEQEERPEYAKRASMVGAATLMTNYLGSGAPQADVSYGGAMVVAADGSILDCFPLGQEGILFVDL